MRWARARQRPTASNYCSAIETSTVSPHGLRDSERAEAQGTFGRHASIRKRLELFTRGAYFALLVASVTEQLTKQRDGAKARTHELLERIHQPKTEQHQRLRGDTVSRCRRRETEDNSKG
jgi:hypothetical protein